MMGKEVMGVVVEVEDAKEDTEVGQENDLKLDECIISICCIAAYQGGVPGMSVSLPKKITRN